MVVEKLCYNIFHHFCVRLSFCFSKLTTNEFSFLFFDNSLHLLPQLQHNFRFCDVFFLRNIMKVVSSSLLFSSTSFSLLLIIIALIVFLDVHSIPSSPYMANINEFCKNNDELSFAMCRRWYKNLFMQSALIIRWIALRCALCTLHSACSCWKKRIRWNREREKIRKNKKLQHK